MSEKQGTINGLERITRTSVRDQTLEQLKNFIVSGELGPGERLPSERALSEALGVGRYSVREALKILEAVGLVESRPPAMAPSWPLEPASSLDAFWGWVWRPGAGPLSRFWMRAR